MILPFLQNFGLREHDSAFFRENWTARRPAFSNWHNGKLFAVPAAFCFLHYVLPGLWQGYECHGSSVLPSTIL